MEPLTKPKTSTPTKLLSGSTKAPLSDQISNSKKRKTLTGERIERGEDKK